MFENIDFADPTTQIVSVLVGFTILLLGRKLFWLFVGAAGFVIGLSLAVELFKDQPDWVIVVVAVVIGLVGALLAVVAQKVAVIIAGFIMGGYTLIWLFQTFSLDLGPWDLVIFVIGGIFGAILVRYLFEVALIALSSLGGAVLIVQVTNQFANFGALVTAFLFILLLLVGVTAQVQMWRERSFS